MKPGELRARLDALGLGDREFAAEYGANPRTVQRWKSGKQDIPKDMDHWLSKRESRLLD